MEYKERMRITARPSRTAGRVLVSLATMASVTSLGFASASAAQPESVAVTKPAAVAAKADVTSYPADPAARDFNAGAKGWIGYQERSAGCWVRGVSCPKVDTVWKKDGGKDGAGDGFLRFAGNSAAVYGFPWGQGSYTVWQTHDFTYTSGDAKSWTIDLDWRATHASYAIGWNGIQVEIRDESGRTVRTAMPGKVSVPTGNWSHVHVPFDGEGVLKEGERYHISVVQIDYYGPSAATLGHHDIDNVELKASPEAGEAPVIKCREDGVTNTDAVKALKAGPASTCAVTKPLSKALLPAAKVVDGLAKQPAIASMLEKGEGAFVVFDRASGQTAAWAVGRENIPSSDPRRVFMWLQGDNVGGAADFAIYFVVSNPEHVMNETFGHPGGLPGAVSGVIQGQADAAGEVLSNPVGEALDVDGEWSVANVVWHATALLGGDLPVGGLPDAGLPTGGLPEGGLPAGGLPVGGLPIPMPS